MSCLARQLYYDDRKQIAEELIKRFMQRGVQDPVAPPVVQLPVEELDTDFKRKFPPDPFGHEADDDARVWKVYHAQACAYDDALLDGWNGALDIHLIFAGLFSAVAAAFLVDSYQRLDFDTDGFVVNALYRMVGDQNATGSSIPLPSPPPVSKSPTSASRWINGLWFSSLALTLTVALASILVRQRLREYKARNLVPAASPRKWAQGRQLRYHALLAWDVGDLISGLSLLLHAALFLFMTGAAILLWNLDRTIAIVIVLFAATLAAFYMAFLGIQVSPRCPGPVRRSYNHTLIVVIRTLVSTSKILKATLRRLRHVSTALLRRSATLLQAAATSALTWVASSRSQASALPTRSHGPAQMPRASSPTSQPHEEGADGVDSGRAVTPETRFGIFLQSVCAGVSYIATYLPTVESCEQRLRDLSIYRHLRFHSHDLDASALLWLITAVSDSDAVAIAIQAIGGLRPSSPVLRLILARGVVPSRDALLRVAFTRSSCSASILEAARIAKTWHLVGIYLEFFELSNDGQKMMTDLSAPFDHRGSSMYPDFCLLGFLYQHRVLAIPPELRYSPTATATIMLLLHRYRSQVLYLLEYCHFSSPAMDWDTVVSAAQDDSQSWWEEQGIVLHSKQSCVPSHLEYYEWLPENASSAACICLALIQRLSRPSDADRYDHPPNYRQILLDVIVRLMLTVSPAGQSSSRYAAVYGPGLFDLIDFMDSPDYPIRDPAALAKGLEVLQSASELYGKEGRIGEMLRAVGVGMHLLMRSAEGSTRPAVEFAEGLHAFAHKSQLHSDMDAPECAQFLSIVLTPDERWPSTTVYKELWNHSECAYFMNVLHYLISLLVRAQTPASDLWTHLMNTFFAELTSVADIVRIIASGAVHARPWPVVAVIDIIRAYRTLRPNTWSEELRVVETDPDNCVRGLALELRRATETNREELDTLDADRRMMTIYAAARDSGHSSGIPSSSM